MATEIDFFSYTNKVTNQNSATMTLAETNFLARSQNTTLEEVAASYSIIIIKSLSIDVASPEDIGRIKHLLSNNFENVSTKTLVTNHDSSQ